VAVLSEGGIADELAIRRLTAAFSDAVSRRDRAAFEALWAPDGRWLVPGLEETVGPAAAAEQLLRLVEPFEFLLQLLHEGQVWVDETGGRARWYIVEHGRTKEGQGVHYVGVYQDRHVRTDGGWRFARRHFELLYRGFAELAGKAYLSPALDW